MPRWRFVVLTLCIVSCLLVLLSTLSSYRVDDHAYDVSVSGYQSQSTRWRTTSHSHSRSHSHGQQWSVISDDTQVGVDNDDEQAVRADKSCLFSSMLSVAELAALHGADSASSDHDSSSHPYVYPLVSPFLPRLPTVSTYSWVSFPSPIWQGIIEPTTQLQDATSVSFRLGKIIFHGLSATQQAELHTAMSRYKHLDGTTFYYDDIDDVLAFDSSPLNWSNCQHRQLDYAFIISPWQSQLYYHLITDNLLPMYANVRSANALPAKQLATFSSSLASDLPNTVFTPLPVANPTSVPLSPFSVSHLTNLSSAVLYVNNRYARFAPLPARQLLYDLFAGQVRDLNELKREHSVCFRRMRWGRGPPMHYLNQQHPFPPHSDSVLYTSKQVPINPQQATELGKNNLSLYSSIETLRWSGLVIDYHNWVMHQNGLARRVREGRHPDTHRPLCPDVTMSGGRTITTSAPGAVGGSFSSAVRVIHISRSHEKGRFIANPSALFAVLSEMSPRIIIIDCCDLGQSIGDQLPLFQAGDIMIGLHGAGLINQLFMPPGGLVVEILSVYAFDNNYFAPIAKHLDHVHLKVDAREFHRDQAGYMLSDAFIHNLSRTIWNTWEVMEQRGWSEWKPPWATQI